MKVSIFQPTYLSWLGFYKAINWADKFVFLDDVQFEHHSWQTRNRIKSTNSVITLTIPIVRHFPQKINEVKINYAQDWLKKHLKAIQVNYSRAPFFSQFFPILESFYQQRPQKLVDLNVKIIKGISDFLGLESEFYYSSKLDVARLHKNEKVIAILKKLGATKYLYAEGATGYMKETLPLYKKAELELISLKFEHPFYQQLYGGFVSHLSIIDVIFNCGKEGTSSILKNISLAK